MVGKNVCAASCYRDAKKTSEPNGRLNRWHFFSLVDCFTGCLWAARRIIIVTIIMEIIDSQQKIKPKDPILVRGANLGFAGAARACRVVGLAEAGSCRAQRFTKRIPRQNTNDSMSKA